MQPLVLATETDVAGSLELSQCRGKTKTGDRCRRKTPGDSHYCHQHTADTDWLNDVALPLAGGAFAFSATPAVVPVLVGIGLGKLVGILNKEENTSKPRVFISFDYDNDSALKEFLLGQAKNEDSPFEINNWSINEPISVNWEMTARERIRDADQVVVICGTQTHNAKGVSIEIKIAQEEGRQYFLLAGYKDANCTRPTAARPDDKLYSWTWDNLKSLVGGGR